MNMKWWFALGLAIVAEATFIGISSIGLMPSNSILRFIIDVVVIGLIVRLGMEAR